MNLKFTDRDSFTAGVMREGMPMYDVCDMKAVMTRAGIDVDAAKNWRLQKFIRKTTGMSVMRVGFTFIAMTDEEARDLATKLKQSVKA